MHLGKLAITLCALIASSALHAQTNTAAGFAAHVAAKYTELATVHSITLNGTAKWTAGSLHESGPAKLQASVDGSSTLQLSLNTASRTETRTALGTSRTCEWTDAKSAVHPLVGPDCESAVPWFAPILLVQPVAAVANALNIADDGQVAESGSTLRELSYRTVETGKNAALASALTEDTYVRVLYDPETLLPARAEYAIHADSNLHIQIPVKVIYSNYQTVSGVPIPFQIDRYVNGVLQLSVTLTNASLN